MHLAVVGLNDNSIPLTPMHFELSKKYGDLSTGNWQLMLSKILFNFASKTINEPKQNLFYQVTNVQYLVEGNEFLLRQKLIHSNT